MKTLTTTLVKTIVPILFACSFAFASPHIDKALVKKVASRHFHAAATKSKAVDINHATAKGLERLKGIGPKRAAQIVAYRTVHGNFKSIDDLSKLKGITAGMIAKLRRNNAGMLKLNY